jgi:exopolysaccharide production protein ExoQ
VHPARYPCRVRLLGSRRARAGFAVLSAFTVLAPDAWRNSLGWYGFGVVALVVIGGSVALLVRERRTLRLASVPAALVAFLVLATLSIAWSEYRLESVGGVLLQLGTTAVGLAFALLSTPAELLAVLGTALRAILALSIAFELVVALVIRHPVFPVWVREADRVDPNPLLYWSRDVLFDDGKIQGITGSSTLLAMLALVALIVFTVQLASGAVRRLPGGAWVAVALLVIGLTRSATIILGLVAVVAVLAGILLLRRAAPGRGRMLVGAGIAVAAVAALVAGILFRGAVLGALGKSDTFTGRFGIWEAVIGLAVQRPLFGWGWISYWAPWIEPFRGLAFAGGMEQLHAHNAWLDVWLQLGLVGVVVFAGLVLTALVRATRVAIAAPAEATGSVALAWPLLGTALLVQSFAESRILVEGGWVLLVVVAVQATCGRLERMPVRAPARLGRR